MNTHVRLLPFGLNRVLKLFDELNVGDPHRLTEHSQLYYVNPALTPLAPTDKGLRLPDQLGKLDLSDPSFLSGLDQALQEDDVFPCVDSLFHKTIPNLHPLK